MNLCQRTNGASSKQRPAGHIECTIYIRGKACSCNPSSPSLLDNWDVGDDDSDVAHVPFIVRTATLGE
jgi:hypothetical protein